MQNIGFLKRIMTLGERQALKEYLPYIEISAESTSLLIEMLSYASGKREDINEKIRANERKADDLTQSIKNELTHGAINSSLLDTLLTLTEKFDDLLDRTYYISREIMRISHAEDTFDESSISTVRKSYSYFSEMLKLHITALSYLSSIIKASKDSDIIDLRKKIELLEEKVDDMKDTFIDSVYRTWRESNYLVFTHVIGIVHKVDDLLDDCEDISDMVMTIVSSVAK